MKFPLQGLYAITPDHFLTDDELINNVTAAIKGGANVIQYRDKHKTAAPSLLKELINICHKQQIPLIINDDIKLAIELGADGVHIGKEDGDIAELRQGTDGDFIIGVSCYNSVQQARHAQDNGADYVAFGRFFPSTSKPQAPLADLQTIRHAKQEIQIPIVAIGGITVNNAQILLKAGADLLAVIGGVFNNNPEDSAKEFNRLFKAE